MQGLVHDVAGIFFGQAGRFFQVDAEQCVADGHEPKHGVAAFYDGFAVAFVVEDFRELLFEELFLIVSGQHAGAVVLVDFGFVAFEMGLQVFNVVFALVILEKLGGLVQGGVAPRVKHDGQPAGFRRQLGGAGGGLAVR